LSVSGLWLPKQNNQKSNLDRGPSKTIERDDLHLKASEKKKVLIVIPTYNEKENIKSLYLKIRQYVRNAHMLIVDDGSPDGTGDVADGLSEKDPLVHVLHRAKKMGLGTAYVAGFDYALKNKYKFVLAMDADLSHDPANIPIMIELMEDYDLVIGSRYVKDGGMVNWGMGRFLISKFANGFLKGLLNISQKDCSGGYKCYRSDLLKAIGLERIFSKGYAFQVEILYRALRLNAKIVEIPIVFVNRHEGKSKLNFSELINFAKTVFKLRLLSWAGRL
jgi:dolichol-phosphate mannosyltransferase